MKALGIPEEDADNEMLLLVAMFQAVTEDRDTKAFDKVMDVLGKTVQREELTLKKRQAAKQDKPSNGMTEQLIAGMQEQGWKMIYTKKQRQLMELWRTKKLQRINLLEGSVSSGKTWISLVCWGFWLATMPQNQLYLMCGKSLTTLKRNCLIPLEAMFGQSNFSFQPLPKKPICSAGGFC